MLGSFWFFNCINNSSTITFGCPTFSFCSEKFSRTSLLTPLPLLLIGISSSPEIDTALNTSAHFNLSAVGITGFKLFATAGSISRNFSNVLLETSFSFVSTTSATEAKVCCNSSSLMICLTASFKGS